MSIFTLPDNEKSVPLHIGLISKNIWKFLKHNQLNRSAITTHTRTKHNFFSIPLLILITNRDKSTWRRHELESQPHQPTTEWMNSCPCMLLASRRNQLRNVLLKNQNVLQVKPWANSPLVGIYFSMVMASVNPQGGRTQYNGISQTKLPNKQSVSQTAKRPIGL
jgi:hypothetical protein